MLLLIILTKWSWLINSCFPSLLDSPSAFNTMSVFNSNRSKNDSIWRTLSGFWLTQSDLLIQSDLLTQSVNFIYRPLTEWLARGIQPTSIWPAIWPLLTIIVCIQISVMVWGIHFHWKFILSNAEHIIWDSSGK